MVQRPAEIFAHHERELLKPMVPIHSCRTVLQRAVPLALASLIAAIGTFAAETPPAFSGIYPHLAMFNSQGECGTGALVPWANKLWVVTYSPHSPKGSGDKLYSIDTALQQTIHPESIGGTPANRFIHTESQQLFIVSYQPPPRNRILAVTERNCANVAPQRLTNVVS